MLDAWSQLYVSIHADWSPTAEDGVLIDIFGDIVDDIDADLSVGAWLGDRLVAVSFVLAESPTSATIVAETLTRPQVGGCELLRQHWATALSSSRGRGSPRSCSTATTFDPHLAPITADLPASRRHPLLLVELPTVKAGH